MTTARPFLDLSSLRIQVLTEHTSLDGFCCGERDVDRAVAKCCMWNSEHKARTYCAFIGDDPKARAFYTLSMHAQDGKYLDPDITRGTPGHIVFLYLNYFGVEADFQQRGIGSIMLGHALRRCALIAKTAGSFGVALNALTQRAHDMYYKYGFRAADRKPYPFMILPTQSLFDLVALEAGTASS